MLVGLFWGVGALCCYVRRCWFAWSILILVVLCLGCVLVFRCFRIWFLGWMVVCCDVVLIVLLLLNYLYVDVLTSCGLLL